MVAAGDEPAAFDDGLEPLQLGPNRLAAFGDGPLVDALTERDRWICSQVSPVLQEMGILFAGLDVIGDYLTEINITSPTCIRELDHFYDLDIGGQMMQTIAARLS